VHARLGSFLPPPPPPKKILLTDKWSSNLNIFQIADKCVKLGKVLVLQIR
jgi:hypothetical protein